MTCPICQNPLEEWDQEWISDVEMSFEARCPTCGWRGSKTYVSQVEYWDSRTREVVPSDPEALEAWRSENAKFYKLPPEQ